MIRFDDLAGVRWSVHVSDVDSGEVLLADGADLVLDTASVGKLFLLHTLLSEVDAGVRCLSDTATRLPSEWMDNSGLWYRLQVDTLSLYDLATLVAAVSDNAATNTLLRVVGLDAVRHHTRALGYTASGLDDRVRWPLAPGDPRTLSHGSARELASFCAALSLGEGLSQASADTFRYWLGASCDLSMVASAFGLDPLAHDLFDRDLWVWNKTGTISTVRADVGVAMSPGRRIAYAVLAQWERGLDVRDAVLARMREVGTVIRGKLEEGE